jgi:hypothetical protein
MSRFCRLRRWWPVLAGVLLALLIYAAWPGRSTFTVGKETTYITEPLDANGHPDYQAALNERLREGVTPETNANVLLWQAMGPRPEGSLMPTDYFRWLGVDQPPEEGNYFVFSDKFFDAHLKDRPEKEPEEGWDEDNQPPDRKQEWWDRMERTRKWPWTVKEQPDVADWLKRNDKPLALVIEATKRSQYYNPLATKRTDPGEPKLLNSLLPNVQRCRDLANALASRAMGRVGAGDHDGAWQDLMACQRLGRLVARGATLIDSLVGIALVAVATDAQLAFLSHGKHSSKQLLTWLEDLRNLGPMPPLATKMDLGERFVMLDAVVNIAKQPPGSTDRIAGPAAAQSSPPFVDRLFTRSIDWDPALRNMNRAYDRAAEAARLPERAARKRESARIEDDFEQANAAARQASAFEKVAMGKSETGERMGNILIALLLPAMQKIQDAMDRIEQSQRNLHVAVALAAYRADSGRYPAGLAELAPEYLPSVPNDIFSGGPLIYRPEKDGYLLYSVGINGQDDGGRWTDDDPPGDDLRVRMPVPEPKPKAKPKADPGRRHEID